MKIRKIYSLHSKTTLKNILFRQHLEKSRNRKITMLYFFPLSPSPSVRQPDQDGVLRILSWNIDGLDPDNLQSRTEGACAVLLQEHPEVIFLQEVVHRSLSIIKTRLEHRYTVVTGDLDVVNTPGAYFTAMLLKKDCVERERVRVMDYPGSLMDRDLMEVQCTVRGVPMVCLTSHLESTKEYGEERQRQLKTAFDHMIASPQDRTVIFGGDLNLRDKEVSGASAKPSGVYDLWECTGKRQEAKFTWDLMINDNKQMPSKFQPRCRFDRLYVRHCYSNGKKTISAKSSDSKNKERPISSYFTSPGKKQASSGNDLKNRRESTETVDNNVTSCSSSKSKTPSLESDATTLMASSLNSQTKHTHLQIDKPVVNSSSPLLKPVYFELVGIQRLASCRRFPSDHWGILTHLQILNKSGAL
ncbi:tyrosyl-DNA phosphodiesterase 2-like [Elysia marginata]|uniref:Tyrosyl-DNA phosphodiesterase 2-like n=1 Tax=Elysia marginata TaxID=1093978 RepID=A0AAV4FA80_9GAST|nr:tyrosyl-DNA phosphodiesterase 2-like [Elysia marginata]